MIRPRPLLEALGWTLASFVFALLAYLTIAEIVGNMQQREVPVQPHRQDACYIDPGLPGCSKTGGVK